MSYKLLCDTNIGEMSSELPSKNILSLENTYHFEILESYMKNICENTHQTYMGNLKLKIIKE